MWLSWARPAVAPAVDSSRPSPETNATAPVCSLMMGLPPQKSKSSPVNTLLVHTPSVAENADPRLLTADTSVCQLSPARLNMMGYQRTPPEYASMLPRSLGVAYSGGVRWYPIMFSRAGLSWHTEISAVRMQGSVFAGSDRVWATSVFSGLDFDF